MFLSFYGRHKLEDCYVWRDNRNERNLDWRSFSTYWRSFSADWRSFSADDTLTLRQALLSVLGKNTTGKNATAENGKNVTGKKTTGKNATAFFIADISTKFLFCTMLYKHKLRFLLNLSNILILCGGFWFLMDWSDGQYLAVFQSSLWQTVTIHVATKDEYTCNYTSSPSVCLANFLFDTLCSNYRDLR